MGAQYGQAKSMGQVSYLRGCVIFSFQNEFDDDVRIVRGTLISPVFLQIPPTTKTNHSRCCVMQLLKILHFAVLPTKKSRLFASTRP